MGIHRYKGTSVIDQVTLVKTDAGGFRAYLHARPGLDPETFAAVKQGLNEKGWQHIPSHHNGQPVLELRGFGDAEALFKHLRKSKLVDGIASFAPHESDNPKFGDIARKSTLAASGLCYLVGDYGFTKYGYTKGSNLDIAGGISYIGGSSSLLGFGKGDKSHHQIKDISRKLIAKLNETDVNLLGESALIQAGQSGGRGIRGKVHEFLDKYPAEIMNGFFAFAGMFILSSAVKELIHGKSGHISGLGLDPNLVNSYERFKNVGKYLDIGLGSMTIASGLTSIFMKEKARDPEKPKAKGLGAVMEWVREKPLRVAGYGYMVSTLLHAGSTSIEWNFARKIHKGLNGQVLSEKGRKVFEDKTQMLSSIPYRALFVFMNLIAEFLMAISSKGHGDGVKSDDSIEKSSYDIAADLIARQPAHRREGLVDYLAGFMAEPEVLGGKQEVIATKLRERLGTALDNPWVGSETVQHGADTSNLPKPSEIPNWVARSANPAQAATLAAR